MKNEEEALKRAKGYYGVQEPMCRVAYSFFCDGAEWKEEVLIQKVSEWLDSILVYDNDGDLKCNNFKSYDELIEDLKKSIKDEKA